MELTWLMRLRITGAIAIGVVLIGVLCWPLAAPAEPSGAVRAANISFGGAVALAAAAFLAGLIAYFVSWPYGQEIGVLAVPFGLAVWAGRSGNMGALMQLNPTITQRQAVFVTLQWEGLFWLFLVAAGLAGVFVAQKIVLKHGPGETAEEADPKPGRYINGAIALVGSVLISQFLISIFAQDVRASDGQLGSVVGQPAVGQIIFAVVISFGFVAFLARTFLGVGYIWSLIASGLVTTFGMTFYAKQNLLEHLVESWPAVFFSNAVISILPVQMVAFGTLGSIAGYWLAVRYNFGRKGENK